MLENMSKHPKSNFSLDGQFLGFIDELGAPPKRFKLQTSHGEYWIKLSKELRPFKDWDFRPGDWLHVNGELKLDSGKLKMKASTITVLSGKPSSRISSSIEASPSSSRKPAQILVCQKSDCWKRGGQAICQALAANLQTHELTDSVQVVKTGCMKQCKSGPNLVVMPDKARYSRLHPSEVPMVIQTHFLPSQSSVDLCQSS
jgi:(2Fe-2S) ferredoxin